MENLEQAIEKIKELECPTGEVEQRVEEILAAYEREAKVRRNEKLDRNGAHAYSVSVEEGTLAVLAKSGMDDYVAKVVDVYIR